MRPKTQPSFPLASPNPIGYSNAALPSHIDMVISIKMVYMFNVLC